MTAPERDYTEADRVAVAALHAGLRQPRVALQVAVIAVVATILLGLGMRELDPGSAAVGGLGFGVLLGSYVGARSGLQAASRAVYDTASDR